MSDIVFALAASLGVNALFFAAAASLRTDKVTDLSYGLSFLAIDLAMILRSGSYDPGRLAAAALVALWALRLAIYLVSRIVRIGVDRRFDGIRENPARFARFWLLQALTAWIVSLPLIVYVGGAVPRRPGPVQIAFFVVALAALVFESVADAQKSAFHRDPGKKGSFVSSGLWRFSRHPNYFGETAFWWAFFVAVAGDFSGAELASILGPAFISFLLIRVSGIPLLEKASDSSRGADPEYLAYKERTSIFVPLPPRKAEPSGAERSAS